MIVEEIELAGDPANLVIGVAVADFNRAITDRLLDGCLKTLEAEGVGRVRVVRVPGAWELAIAAGHLATAGCAAVVAVGAVIKGETDHYEVIVRESATGIMRASIDSGVPITNAVLAVHDYEQALDRSEPGPGNKAAEAARAAVEMGRRLRGLRG
ncbi:MAG TPA: 6,7-dimethyl-8-ribityllumazine synthase [Acidimicrobiia bacterium]|nr:6,7-dimethyl-8-ribityllumazine synthase [Acidimicrobiia bacterium]